MDGLEDDHNWMRGHRDSFQHVSQALDHLVEMRDKAGLVFDVVTCVNQRTYPKLTEIRDFLIGKGVKHWRMFSIFPVGRAAKDPVLQLTNEQYRGMLDFIKKTRKEGVINAAYGCEGFLGNYEGEVRDSLLGCQAGISVGSVMANGDIAACASIRADYAQGNIYRDDFLTVWENKYQPYRDRSWMRRDECADCKYFRYCKGNSMHLRDGDGKLITCHLKRLQ
jgi:radical SAM protein with 4Fe4S-binding SPASM domain